MARMTAWDTAQYRHSNWIKTELKLSQKEPVTAGRQLLLAKAAGDPVEFAEYLDDKTSVSALICDKKSGITKMSLPRGVRWENIPKAAESKKIRAHWSSPEVDINPVQASLPVFWTAVHYQAILDGTATGSLSDYLLGASKDEIGKSSHAIHKLGSTTASGYHAPMRLCVLARIFWQDRLAQKIAAVDGHNSDADAIHSFFLANRDVYNSIVNMSVSRLTVLCNDILLAAVIDIAMAYSVNTRSQFNPWLGEIGKEFYGESPDFMEYESVVYKAKNALNRTRKLAA